MSRKKINCKEILRLHDAKLSQNTIASMLHASKKSVNSVIKAASAVGLIYRDVSNSTNDDIYDRLFPEQAQGTKRCYPDMKELHCILGVPGTTLQSEWRVFQSQCKAEGIQAIGYSTMCLGYSEFLKQNPFLPDHVVYKYGANVICSWVGYSPNVEDLHTSPYVFLGIFPASGHIYTELTDSKDEDTFIRCIGHMLFSAGGVPGNITIVHSRPEGVRRMRTYEFVVTEKSFSLGVYYGSAIKLEDENSVIDELATELEEDFKSSPVLPNIQALRRIIDNWCRKKNSIAEVNFHTERKYLRNVPDKMYDVISKHEAPLSVQKNSHVRYRGCYYSVPFEFRGKKVMLQYTDDIVELIVDDLTIAVHDKFPAFVTHRYATDGAHMPPKNKKPYMDKRRFISQAMLMGPSVGQVIERIFAKVDFEEQAYNSAQSILHLDKKISIQRLNEACEFAIKTNQSLSYKRISEILKGIY